ncbi:MAG: lipid-A-disaccharide synthase [Bacteroidales bacterium]|nr:lipid-A-disaccharide synthase [Bacteroidales bacterium]
MKYYIIAGEASGDLHASNLMKAIKAEDGKADFRFWGGDLMAEQGGSLVRHYRDLAFMGFAEVLLNLRTILKNISFCKIDLLRFQPDVLILVDYPGFNLRIAEFARKKGIKVIYYISPQVWAWKQSRVHKIKRTVDKMLVILPFEKDFYKKYGMEVDFVGHPLLDALADEKPETRAHFLAANKLDDKPVVALLPGSRKQEVSKMLEIMLQLVDGFKEVQFVVAGVGFLPDTFYTKIIGDRPVKVLQNKTHAILRNADAALVTSGTATLETALIGVPEVVCYKGNWFSYQIAKRLIHVKYISLVNLIMDREVVMELIQDELNVARLKEELNKLLNDVQLKPQLENDYLELKEKLGKTGASHRAARIIVDFAKRNKQAAADFSPDSLCYAKASPPK